MRISDWSSDVCSSDLLELKLNEPGTLFPTSELFDKLSNGDVDAVWASTNFFAQRDSVFWLFSTVPFGPPAGEYLAWLAYGGGQELMDASFARRSEEHTSELQSLMRSSYAVLCLQKKIK